MNRSTNLTPILIAGALFYALRRADDYVKLLTESVAQKNRLDSFIQITDDRLEDIETILETAGMSIRDADEDVLEGDESELASFLDGVIQQSAAFLVAHEPTDEQKSAWFERPNDDYDLANIREKLALGVNGFQRNRVVVSGVAVAITDAQPNVYFGVVWVNAHNGIPPSIIQVVDAEQSEGMIPRASIMMNVNAVIGNLISGGFLKTGNDFQFGQDVIVGMENLPKVRFLDIRDFAGSTVGEVG